MPASTAARIAAGSSVRGLSSVTISDVGEPGGDRAHDRPLAGVAVAAGAEDDDDLPVGERAQGGEHGLDRVGLVGVVDDHGEVLAGVDPLQPARHSPAGRDAARDLVRVEAGQRRRGDRGERVGDVEGAGDGHPGVDPEAFGAE